MSVGFQPSSKQQVDGELGSLATDWRNLVTRTQQTFVKYSQIDSTTLKGLPSVQGPVYTDADVTLINEVLGQLNTLCSIATNQQAGVQDNYLFWSNQIAQP